MWGATVGEDVSGGRQGRVSHERSALRLIGWWRAAGGAFRCCILRPWSGSRRGWALAMAGRRGSAVSAMAGKSGGAADRAWQWSGGFDTVGGTTGKRRMAPSGLGGQTGLQKTAPGDAVHSLSKKIGEALASGEEMWMVGAGTPGTGTRADQMCGPETGS